MRTKLLYLLLFWCSLTVAYILINSAGNVNSGVDEFAFVNSAPDKIYKSSEQVSFNNSFFKIYSDQETNAFADPDLTIANNLGGSSGYNIENQNGFKTFLRCTNNVSFTGIFEFEDPNAASYPAGTTFTLEWGDGTFSNQVEDHTYNPGFYTLIYTVVLPDNSENTSEFKVFVGTEPQPVSVVLSQSTNCIPNEFSYTVSSQHSPGTVYTVFINDGSDPIILDTSTLTPGESFERTLTHTFLKSSCDVNTEIGDVLYNNAFSVSVNASNPCAPEGNFITTGPVRVSESTTANIEIPGDVACINSIVSFNDISVSGINISSDSCSEDYGRYWEILPNTDYTLETGSKLGSDAGAGADWASWNDGTENLEVVFNETGDYQITLVTRNNCGESRQTQDICIIEVVSEFSLGETTEVCFTEEGTVFSAQNNSRTETCEENPAFEWTVDASNPDCPSAEPEWEFINGTSSTDFEPEFRFITPGVYTISLKVSIGEVFAGGNCFTDDSVTEIIIKDSPKTKLEDLTVCQDELFTLKPSVFDCYGGNQTTYSWNFGNSPPASIMNSNDPNPEISYDTPGNYPYELTLTNECGSNTYTGNIEVLPSAQVEANGPTNSCVNNPISLEGTTSGGTGNVVWSANVGGGSFNPDQFTLNPTYNPPEGFSGDITFTISSDNTATSCEISSDIHIVNVDGPKVNAGNYDPVCINTDFPLSGSHDGIASSILWSSSNGGTFDDETNLNTNFTPPADFVGTLTLTLSVETVDPTPFCTENADSFDLEIFQKGELDTSQLNDLEYCNDEVTPKIVFESPNNSESANFRWEIDEDIGLNPLSGTGNFPSFTTANSTQNPIVATVIVTPFLKTGDTECDGDPGSFTITVQPDPNITGAEAFENYSSENISCFGKADGSITLSNEGILLFNNPSYEYEWNGPNGFTSSEPNLENLEQSLYILKAKEVSSPTNCSSVILEVIIEQPQPLEVTNLISRQAFCFGVNDGSISFSLEGGTPPYTSNYGPVDEKSGIEIENLSPGVYEIEIIDDNGCELFFEVEVDEGFISEIEPPTGKTSQLFCVDNSSTITVSDINVEGMDVKWYLSPNDSESLPEDYLLTESIVLYARNFDQSTGCLSSKTFEVNVTIASNAGITEINNYISVNENNLNDNLNVVDIKEFPDNEMRVYNRYGKLVWETTGYNNSDNTFRGASNVGGTINQGNFLPTGTYYFILNYKSRCKNGIKKGFMQIDNDR